MTLAMPVYEEAHRLLGVDLSGVPGISGGVLCVLMSELGTATHIREKFRSAEAFASWLGLCPDNRISGGRILKAGTRKVTNRIANILRMAANALSREQGRMGEFVRRFKGSNEMTIRHCDEDDNARGNHEQRRGAPFIGQRCQCRAHIKGD